ncbi:MAG: LytTR family transcriptional regulator DNA-binding domain-containing protein [Bacteroides sp.]|jgi:hypothetical protein|nr:LytTR family transcriptional regulator DNA-binding domain-containing protein [Bacteroides sp.]MCI1683319.1 LytTR family transcriptional regulator DNA-binding domain-containing protein [Bacteroides sp.]
MVNKLIVLLQSPYPLLGKRWKTVVYPSVIVFLVLFFFEPFGLSGLGSLKFWVTFGYGLVSALSISIFVYALPLLFRRHYKNWTLGKNFLQTLFLWLTIAIGNWLYSVILFHASLNWGTFGTFLFWVILLGPIPSGFFMLWNRNMLLARNLKEAMEINMHLAKNLEVKRMSFTSSGSQLFEKQEQHISEASQEVGAEDSEGSVFAKEKGYAGSQGAFSAFEEPVKNRMLEFYGSTKEQLAIEADDLMYVEADGNYVKVVYRKADGVGRKLLRCTMKQAEGTVVDCPFIIRCHRAFLVNIRWVVKVDGNSQGFRLSLQGCEEEVPVSRAYTDEVKSRIERTE